jgi:hypothetical protein
MKHLAIEPYEILFEKKEMNLNALEVLKPSELFYICVNGRNTASPILPNMYW